MAAVTLLPKVAKRGRIDKSALALGEPARIHNAEYLAWLHELPCSVPNCRGSPIHAHHLGCSPEPKGRGIKPGSNWAVPVCLDHHQGAASIHASGGERDWWAGHGVDPVALAKSLWAEFQAERGS